MTRVRYLREQTRGAKHVTFDPSGRYVAVSCTDGCVYIYTLVASEEPTLLCKLDGVIRRLEPEDEATSRVVWHPDGTAFAAAEATRDVAVYSVAEWKKEKVFSNGHSGDITALSWSPNGALLVTAAKDGQILLWESKSQRILQRYDFSSVINLAWHLSQNCLSFTTSDGELFIHDDFVPREHQALLSKPLQAAPIFPGPLAAGPEAASAVAATPLALGRRRRAGSPDSLDDILGSVDGGMEDDFVEDDDGAGYTEDVNLYGKRPNGHLDELDGHADKRQHMSTHWQPKLHPPVQSGSTPWRGNRRYLCMLPSGERPRHLALPSPFS